MLKYSLPSSGDSTGEAILIKFSPLSFRASAVTGMSTYEQKAHKMTWKSESPGKGVGFSASWLQRGFKLFWSCL